MSTKIITFNSSCLHHSEVILSYYTWIIYTDTTAPWMRDRQRICEINYCVMDCQNSWFNDWATVLVATELVTKSILWTDIALLARILVARQFSDT